MVRITAGREAVRTEVLVLSESVQKVVGVVPLSRPWLADHFRRVRKVAKRDC